jgi:hypothetical protein
VDDVKSTLMTTLTKTTTATGLSCYVAAEPTASLHSAFTAPFAAAQGTGLSIAGLTTSPLAAAAAAPAQAVVVDVRNTDLPGSHPRGAPV